MRYLVIWTILFIAIPGYSQNINEILLQYSGQSITIRKSGENNQLFYAEKYDKLLAGKEELAAYSDSTFYLVKPTVVIFEAKQFETDIKPQIYIRVDYYIIKPNGAKIKIDNWGKSYYPGIQKIVKMQDSRERDGKVLFTMDDKAEWIVERDKDGKTSIFYISHRQFAYLDYALMFPDCKKEIENGIKVF